MKDIHIFFHITIRSPEMKIASEKNFCYLQKVNQFLVPRQTYRMNPWILDGNSKIVAQVRINLCYLICLRRLIKSRAVTNISFLRKELFSVIHAQHVLSDHVI